MRRRKPRWMAITLALGLLAAGGITTAALVSRGHRAASGYTQRPVETAVARLAGDGVTALRENAGEVSTEGTEPDLSLGNVFASAADRASRAVVEVNVLEVYRQAGSPELARQGLGSGILVGRSTDTVWVLTNNHVAGNASEIQVVLADGRVYQGRLVGADAETDLALISFKTRDDVPLATLGDSDRLRVGDWVIAVGNPLGFESSVTAGIVSALGRHVDARSGIAALPAYIQTDAAINSGSSGGALVNLRGEVVGINTWIASGTGESIGIGFAIPINTVKERLRDLVPGARTTQV